MVVTIVIILVSRIVKSDNVIDMEARTWTLSCCPLGFSSKSLPRMSNGLKRFRVYGTLDHLAGTQDSRDSRFFEGLGV